MKKTWLSILLISVPALLFAAGTPGQSAAGTPAATDKPEKLYTVNTDPLLWSIGMYYLTFDIKIADHFILGNAIGIRAGKLSLIPSLRGDTLGLTYTCGLAYFPFNPEAKGFHLAAFVTPGIMFKDRKAEFSPNLGAYLGYSFHFWNAIKLSLKAGGMLMFSGAGPGFKTEPYPHVSFETGYMF
jgi:hypothetical protein